ncbi:MAG: rod shape-determining protein MreD [Anaerovoracaceae bacterium]
MKQWKAVIVYLGAFILQPFLYSLVPEFGITPNLLLCVTVSFVLLIDDSTFAIFYGVVFALFYDICYGQYIGVNGISMVIVALILFFLREFTNVENILPAMLSGVVTTWLYNSIFWVIMHFAGSPYEYMAMLRQLPWQMLFNVIVIMIIYFILIKRVIRYRRDRYFK